MEALWTIHLPSINIYILFLQTVARFQRLNRVSLEVQMTAGTGLCQMSNFSVLSRKGSGDH